MQAGSLPSVGGCQCGAIRFVVTEPPHALYVCHCRKCRKQSASAFGISVIVPRTALRVTSGTPAHWSCAGDSGRIRPGQQPNTLPPRK